MDLMIAIAMSSDLKGLYREGVGCISSIYMSQIAQFRITDPTSRTLPVVI